MTTYRWVRHPDGGDRLRDVGVQPDGTLHNPHGYPDALVRKAVAAADARRHARRSAAATRAAVTRQRRMAQRVYAAARLILLRRPVGPRGTCYICDRTLDDPASIARGIGSECWEKVLEAVAAARGAGRPGPGQDDPSPPPAVAER